MEAVTIGSVAVLPCLAPSNARERKHDWCGVGAVRQIEVEIPQPTLLSHVRRGTVMIEAAGPLLQAPCEEVKLGRMQITGGWIHAQSVPVSGGRNELGRADRSGIEQQLRKEGRAVASRRAAGDAVKHCESGDFRGGRIGWKV